MNLINRKMLRDVDLLLVIAAAAAFVYGCVVLYSATYAQPSLTSADPLSIVKKQAVAGLIGLSLALSFMIVGHSILQRAHLLVYAGSVLLLIAVTLVGTRVRGALGWIRVGGFSLQPVEFVKYGIAVALAGHLARKEGPLGIAETVVPLLMAAVPTGIVILQNDLGSALVFIPMVLAMLWAAGADTKVVLGLMAAGLFIAAPLGYFLFLDDYQKARILTFFNPGRDPFGAGYNVIQSVIGIGSGGLLGKGYTGGTQVQLGFVPEHHSDFIFTVIGEELGFIGTAIALLVLMAVIWRCLRIGMATEDRFGNLMCIGISTVMATHVAINVGMSMAIMPCTGIPLPFFSAAGSSVMATLMGLGMAQSVSMRRKKILF